MYKCSKILHANSNQIINITKNAWTKMKSINLQTKNSDFLFSVNSGGCGGLQYDFTNIHPSVLATITKKSTIPPSCIQHNSLSVHIDPLSEMYLHGTTIDYISEDYERGVYESKFVFMPSKSFASTCGCGISFHMIDDDA